MGDHNIINNFVEILKKNRTDKHVLLYGAINTSNNQNIKPGDVLESVYSQIKKIQSADEKRSKNVGNKDIDKVKESSFLTVNKLSVYHEAPRQTTSLFETQCISDTQLINLIDDAEAKNACNGITQEFSSTFHHTNDRNIAGTITSHDTDRDIPVENEEVDKFSERNIAVSLSSNATGRHNNKFVETQELDIIFNDLDDGNCVKPFANEAKTREISEEDDETSHTQAETNTWLNKETDMDSGKIDSKNVHTLQKMTLNILEANRSSKDECYINCCVNEMNKLNDDEDDLINHLQLQNSNKAIYQNKDFCIMNETNHAFMVNDSMDVEVEEKRTPSPVFTPISRRNKTKSPIHLVVSLERFEEFERITQPLVNINTLKHVLNSQLSGAELCMTTNVDQDYHRSPSIDKNDDFHNDCVSVLSDETLTQEKVKDIREKCNDSLKDEILFSSDEENEHIHGELLDVPLTIALETSFYEHSNDLEENMFVGFQTASNKSIKICKDSFCKAQSILHDDDRIISTNFSLGELVEKCDEKLFCSFADLNHVDGNKAKPIEMKLNVLDKECDVIVSSPAKIKSTDVSNIAKVPIYNHTTKSKPADYCHILQQAPKKQEYVGFMTASNKKIKISEKAYDKTKQVFVDIDEEGENQDNLYPEVEKIKVEDNVKNNLKNTDLDDKINDDLIIQEFETSLEEKEVDLDDSKIDYAGFKTASNKKISISNLAMSKVREVFQEIDLSEVKDNANELSSAEAGHDGKKNNKEPKMFIGLETITNKHIEISAQASAESKNMFKNYTVEINANKNINCIQFVDDLNQASKGNEPFVGFKTANNKDIRIQEEALLRSKNIFKDIDSKTVFNFYDKEVKPLKGFKTSSNENLKYLEQALHKISKSQNMYSNDDNAEIIPETGVDIEHGLEADNYKMNVPYINSHLENNKGFQTASHREFTIKQTKDTKKLSGDIDLYSESTFVGFKTASNKKVNISKQSLEKCKKIFGDQNDLPNETENHSYKDKLQNFGFETAHNKSIETSEMVVENIDNNWNVHDINENKIPSKFTGFQTASNKTVEVSKEALVKTKTLFNSINIPQHKEESLTRLQTASKMGVEVKEAKIISQDIEISENNETKPFLGFQTASNKIVKVSEEAVEETKNIFSDIDIIDKEIQTNPLVAFQTTDEKKVAVSKEAVEKSKAIFNGIQMHENKQGFSGFQTANKKKVSVSKEAVEKSKAIFNDIQMHENKQGFSGFQTANKKEVSVSKEAVEKSKAIFNDIQMHENKQGYSGFQTANKKEVSVSKEAVEKSKAIFNDIQMHENKQGFSGFQTANKKEVSVSKEAVEKSKAIFSDIQMHENKQGFSGFQTANKKKVVISEEALARSKHILQDVNSSKEIKLINVKRSNIKSDNNCLLQNMSGINFETVSSALKVPDKFTNNTKIPEDSADNGPTINNTNFIVKNDLKIDEGVAINSIIDTQISNCFQETLCTEDFRESQMRNRRSGSPILIPTAKKRKKYVTPYKTETIKKTDDLTTTAKDTKENTILKFNENYKKNKVFTLKDLPNLGDCKSTAIDPYITRFDLENILNFEFVDVRNDVTNTKMTITELKKLFLSAVKEELVPEGWLDIHLKLILWKLLSYEVKFPNVGLVCTLRNVIDQLKYRYDRELYNSERSALRKIYERDDVPTKTMILCVAGILVDGHTVTSVTSVENIELLLTDGWYFIKATIDKMLAKLVYDGRIVVGCKIRSSGAELVNCEQGMAPWEDTSAVRLKIFGNSTRLAKWESRLGYTTAAILTHLSTVNVNGGKIYKLRVYVTRVYPLLYVEKFEDGSTVTRSERLEHLHQIKYEHERELMMERIYEEVQKEFSDQDSPDSDGSMDGASHIAMMMNKSKDPVEFRAQLTASQIKLLEDHTCKQHESVLRAIKDRLQERVKNRNVIALMRGRVAAVKKDGDKTVITKGMMSVWKPNDAILDLFKEGSWIEVVNVVPTAVRYSEIQISAARQSLFLPPKCKNETHPELLSLKRKCHSISDVTQDPSPIMDYNEIDTVGIVFLIEPSCQDFIQSSYKYQNVYVADSDKNMIIVLFWGGIKKFGYEIILDTGQVVSCANLQKRAGNRSNSIQQFRVTEFSYFTKTPKNLQAREMMDELNEKLRGLDRRKFCEDCIAIKNNYTAIRRLASNENESPYRNNFDNSDYNLAKNKMFIDTPLGLKGHKKEDLNLNLTGLDFESTFKECPQELSPNRMYRKRKLNERIAKLKMYGEPPPLSPISIINGSKRAKNSYKSPLILNSTSNVASTSNKLPEDSPKTAPRDLSRVNEWREQEEEAERKPVISMQRSYVRNVNPVKLNFVEGVAVDGKNKDLDENFLENFDVSPPLSLD